MTSMVERAKRNLNETWQTFGQTGHMRAQALRPELADALVRSVIAALRNPTEAVVDAGMNIEPVGYRYTVNATEIWNAMIDAALAEGGG